MALFRKRGAGRDTESPELDPGPDAPVDAPVDAPAPEPEPGRPPIRVVLVDDDEDLRELMQMGLVRGGFEVVGQAADGTSAVDLVAESQPDLVLLDLHMPEAGGLEVLPVLRAEAPRAKFVVVSGINATHMLEATLDAGVAAFIEKGVSMRSILIHLERVATSGAVKVVRPYPLNREYPADA